MGRGFLFSVMQVTIRPATEDDYEALCRLYAEVDALHSRVLPNVFRDPQGPPRPRELVRETISSEESALFVAVAESDVVGLLDVDIRSAPDYPIIVPRRFAHVSEIVVTENHRGQGLGQLLMERAHRWALEKGASEVELNVWEFNHGAIAFYEKLGYETLHRIMRISLK
jgi:ribosomal protein S18 acetylase RimI-like enzyme